MASKYWDIDDFLAEDELITAQAEQKCYNLAVLDNSAKKDEMDLEAGAKVDIPLWLALRLGSHEFVGVDIPVIFRERFKKVLMADPSVVNLRDKSPYYYEIGIKLCEYIEDKTLIPLMCTVFLTRAKAIIRKSFCSSSEESNVFMKKLTNTERRLFEYGRDSITSYKFWKDDTENAMQFTNANRLRKKVKNH